MNQPPYERTGGCCQPTHSQDEGQEASPTGGSQTLRGLGRLVNGSYSSYFLSSQSQMVHHTGQVSVDLSCRESPCSFQVEKPTSGGLCLGCGRAQPRTSHELSTASRVGSGDLLPFPGLILSSPVGVSGRESADAGDACSLLLEGQAPHLVHPSVHDAQSRHSISAFSVGYCIGNSGCNPHHSPRYSFSSS